MCSRKAPISPIGLLRSSNHHQTPTSCTILSAMDQSCQSPPRDLESVFLASFCQRHATVCTIRPILVIEKLGHLKAMGGRTRDKKHTTRDCIADMTRIDLFTPAKVSRMACTLRRNLQGGMHLQCTKCQTPNDHQKRSVG